MYSVSLFAFLLFLNVTFIDCTSPYNITYVTSSSPGNWRYDIVPPLHSVQVRFFDIDYFEVTATDLGNRPLHMYLNFGLKSEFNATRSLISCDGVMHCEEKTSLRRGDYTLHIYNPHEMTTTYPRYRYTVVNEEMVKLAKAIVVFFVAGVFLPIIITFLMLLMCYMKAKQYLVHWWNNE